MEIRHLKFDKIPSTQDWLKENISKYLGEHLLVSTSKQVSGQGRHGNSWDQFGDSLAFSFVLTPCEVLTLTPLEIGCLLTRFFKNKGADIVLKWPNDLLVSEQNEIKKCGGILCHFLNKDSLLVGVGMNLQKVDTSKLENSKFPPGSIEVDLSSYPDFTHDLSLEIFEFILKNRLAPKEVKKLWDESCIHLNREVKIVDNNSQVIGVFKGIGENGEALIQNQEGLKKVVSGSLWF